MGTNWIGILAGTAITGLIFYVLLPRLKAGHHTGLIIRSMLFGIAVLALGIEFYRRQQYSFMIALGLGCIGFIAMILMMRKK